MSFDSGWSAYVFLNDPGICSFEVPLCLTFENFIAASKEGFTVTLFHEVSESVSAYALVDMSPYLRRIEINQVKSPFALSVTLFSSIL